jgi:5-methylcytosine-specific restriction endonuclease McrA
MEKECKIHGLTGFVFRNDGRFRCKKCAIEAVQRRREKIKQMAVEYKGGKCEKCGYNKYIGALEFHHINGEKDFGIGAKGYTRSWEKVKEELDKCELLCSNCHKEEHAGIE